MQVFGSGLCEFFLAIEHDIFIRGEINNRCCIRGYGRFHLNAFCISLPAIADPSIVGIQIGPGIFQTVNHIWFDAYFFISNASFFIVYSHNTSVHPVTNSAICIVIERIHACRFKCAVGMHTAPSLPNGSGSHFYGIQPRWKSILHEQLISDI